MGAVGKKLHHFVPRFYLKAWAEDGRIYCLQAGEVRRDIVRNLAAENYFYKLQELTPTDVEFLREFIKDSPEGLRKSHEELLHGLMLPYEAKRRLEAAGLATTESMVVIDQAIVEMNENLHTAVEDDFQPYLKAMLSDQLTFLEDPEAAAVFYRSLSVQYARTNHMKLMRITMNDDRLSMYLRIANPLVHLMATNVGLSLYVERKNHLILLLENKTAIPFVTGDQPVINVSSGPKDTTSPAKFELYYPLSPTRAMLLLEPSSDFFSKGSEITETFVQMCNLRMAAHSYRQVFSISREQLESILKELPAYLSCFSG